MSALVLLAATAAGADAAPCPLPSGHSVFLKSGDLDPDVFVWDSKQRVVEYAAGAWRETRDVMAHTVLAKPGTHAVVVQCAAGAVHPQFVADARDAVAIRLTSGPGKGRFGWVTSEDVHATLRR